MNERPDESGYPPSPAPRSEPYTHEETGEAEVIGEPDVASEPDVAGDPPASAEPWRPEPPAHGGLPAPHEARRPEPPAGGGSHAAYRPWWRDPRPAAEEHRGHGPSISGAPGPAQDATGLDAPAQQSAGPTGPAADTAAPTRSAQDATAADALASQSAAASAPAHRVFDRAGSGADGARPLPWSAPGASGGAGAPEEDRHAYPPSSPPAEFVTSGGSAASPAALPYAWRDPAARPWQDPAGNPWQSPGGYPPPPADSAEHGATRRGRRTVGLGVVVLLVLVALLGGTVLGALGARALWPTTTSSALPAPSAPATADRAPESVAGIAAAALESTVFIEVLGENAASNGSGMVLREDGYVVTNNHVIAAAADGVGRVFVTLADGSQEPAQIVGRTADYDIAVLRVDVEGLTPLPLADSDAIVVGDPVVAVGAPLGLEGTVTSGIISALNRPVQAGGAGEAASFINAIQTDAAINPGNSGGPLINTAGEVVGINTAIAQAGGQPTGSIGLGFAIPANQVRRTAEQIIETGQATYPVIGVALDTRYQGEGVQVLPDDAADTPAVTPGGPGDEAGVEPGDVITHVDGQPVTTPSELIVAVRARAPGDTVVLTVRSGNGPDRTVDVVLDEAASQ